MLCWLVHWFHQRGQHYINTHSIKGGRMDGWMENEPNRIWLNRVNVIYLKLVESKENAMLPRKHTNRKRDTCIYIIWIIASPHTNVCVFVYYILFHTTLKTGPQSFTSGKCSAKCECSFKQKRSRMKHIIFIHSLSFFRAFLSTLCSPFLLRLFILFHQNVYEFRSTHS